MEDELQPLLAFSSRTSAEAVAALLESEGVPCVIE
jgi:hypothetical protein